MYKILLSAAFITVLLCLANMAVGQIDSLHRAVSDTLQAKSTLADNAKDDSDFILFIFTFAVAGFGAMIASLLLGVMVICFAILLVGLFVATGVLSASILAGFYAKSVAVGFKTFVIIICSVGGTAIGSIGLFIVTGIFHLDLSNQTALLTGAVGGLLGGVLMGFVIYKILVLCMLYIKKKFALV